MPHRRYATLSALGTCGREQEQGSACPYTTALAPVRADLLNHLAVVVISSGHDPSCCCNVHLPILFSMRDCQISIPHDAAARISSSARKRGGARCKRIVLPPNVPPHAPHAMPGRIIDGLRWQHD